MYIWWQTRRMAKCSMDRQNREPASGFLPGQCSHQPRSFPFPLLFYVSVPSVSVEKFHLLRLFFRKRTPYYGIMYMQAFQRGRATVTKPTSIRKFGRHALSIYTIPACTRSGPSLRPDTPRLCLWDDSVPRDSVDPIPMTSIGGIRGMYVCTCMLTCIQCNHPGK